MPKLLTKVWKTAQGLFFETELEAATREREARINELWDGLKAELLAPEIKARLAAYEQYRKSPGSPYSCPTPPRAYYKEPEGFREAFIKLLEAEGLMVPIKLTTDPQ